MFKFYDMPDEGDHSQNNIVHRDSQIEIKQLMEKFCASEEEVQVAIQVVGDHRDKVEKYLGNKGKQQRYNSW